MSTMGSPLLSTEASDDWRSSSSALCGQGFSPAKGQEFSVKSWISGFLLGIRHPGLFQYLYMKIHGGIVLGTKTLAARCPFCSFRNRLWVCIFMYYMCAMESTIFASVLLRRPWLPILASHACQCFARYRLLCRNDTCVCSGPAFTCESFS